MKSLLVFITLFLASNYGLVYRDETDVCNDINCSTEKPVCVFENKFNCIGKEKKVRLRLVEKNGKIDMYNVKEVFLLNGKQGWKKIDTKNTFDWKEFEGRLLKIITKRIYFIRFNGIDESFKKTKSLTSDITTHSTTPYFSTYFSPSRTIEMTFYLSTLSTPCLSSFYSTPEPNTTASYPIIIPHLTTHEKKTISPYLYILFSFLSSIIIFIVYFFIHNCLNSRRSNRVIDIELDEIL